MKKIIVFLTIILLFSMLSFPKSFKRMGIHKLEWKNYKGSGTCFTQYALGDCFVCKFNEG